MSLFGPPDVENLEEKRDVNALIKAVSYRKDKAVRTDAIKALGRIKDKKAVEPLINALNDDDIDIRMSAAKALGQIKDSRAVEPLIKALNDKSPTVKYDAAMALGEIGDPRAIKPLASKMNTNMDDYGGAARALAKFGTPGIDELISALKDKDQRIRFDACCGLKNGNVRDERIITPLINCLSDEDAYTRKVAVQALDNLGWKPDNIESEAIFSVTKEDWKNCIKIGSPAVKWLIAALKKGDPDSNDDNRDSVAHTLGEIGDPRAVEPLLEALVDQYPHYTKCKSIAYALINIGDSRAIGPLRSALNHSEKNGARCLAKLGSTGNVRQFAEFALEGLLTKLPDTFFSEIQDSSAEVRKLAAKNGSNIGIKAVNPLIVALKDKDEGVRYYAALSLVAISKESSIDNNVRQRIITQQEMRVIFEPRCAICEKKITDPEPKSVGESLNIKYFCSDECLNKQGLVYGSPDGVGCPFYSKLRMCVPPVGSSSPCSYKGGSFRLSCHVYATYKPR